MSREIKFRAWPTKRSNPRMEEVCRIIFFGREIRGNCCQIRFLFGDWYLVPEQAILMQFTGLKDKNGVEIYEGDIVYEAFVEHFGYFNIPEDCQGRERSRDETTGFVEYCKDDCSFKIRQGDDGWFLTDTADELEVIGNIHESPELLEVKQCPSAQNANK